MYFRLSKILTRSIKTTNESVNNSFEQESPPFGGVYHTTLEGLELKILVSTWSAKIRV